MQARAPPFAVAPMQLRTLSCGRPHLRLFYVPNYGFTRTIVAVLVEVLELQNGLANVDDIVLHEFMWFGDAFAVGHGAV